MRTDARRRMLATWLDFRREPPTPARLMRRHARTIATTFAIVVAAIALYAFIGDPYWTGGAIGFGLAVLLQLLQKLRLAALAWPVTAEFLDWPRIERAAREAGLDAHPAHDGMVE